MKCISFRHQSGLLAGMVMTAIILIVSPGLEAVRDPSFDQPGAGSNVTHGFGRDPGVNQFGAAVNRGASSGGGH